jgi:2-desacetyl-2-hydroxyethyl bacteriochlorophyllide A dehydrogenase
VRAARAVWFAGPGRAEIREESLPVVGPREIVVRAERSAISHGTEMLVYRGQVPPEMLLDLPTLAGSFAFPIKYGYASVGTVLETGREVTDVQAGHRVFCLHPHQTTYIVPADLAWRLPHNLSPERGVFAANVETALNVLLDTPVRLGERVLVLGQGTVGLLIGLLARRNGAGRVVVVDPIEQRRTLALGLGADAALDSVAATPDAISEALGGRPDLVYEVSGSPRALQAAIDAVADEGTVTVCSWYGTKTVPLMLGEHFHRGRVRLRSSQVGRIAPELAGRWDYGRRRAAVLDLLAELPVERLISHRFTFEEAVEAYALVAGHANETVQVVLTYGAGRHPSDSATGRTPHPPAPAPSRGRGGDDPLDEGAL